jgi:predicted CopG family antitoxin
MAGGTLIARKTTVLLREDVYQAIKEKAGARNASNLINRILIEYLTTRESMFGTMKKTNVADLRDHRERS